MSGYLAPTMRHPWRRRLASLALSIAILGGAAVLPVLDAVAHHQNGGREESLRPHFESSDANGCHGARCLLARAWSSGLTVIPPDPVAVHVPAHNAPPPQAPSYLTPYRPQQHHLSRAPPSHSA
ncbi:MAG: hypothetical protein AB7I33_02780 [Gemmatimonadales bacterium]